MKIFYNYLKKIYQILLGHNLVLVFTGHCYYQSWYYCFEYYWLLSLFWYFFSFFSFRQIIIYDSTFFIIFPLENNMQKEKFSISKQKNLKNFEKNHKLYFPIFNFFTKMCSYTSISTSHFLIYVHFQVLHSHDLVYFHEEQINFLSRKS